MPVEGKLKERGMFIRMPGEMHRKLRTLAFYSERPQADLIREAINRYLVEHEKGEKA